MGLKIIHPGHPGTCFSIPSGVIKPGNGNPLEMGLSENVGLIFPMK